MDNVSFPIKFIYFILLNRILLDISNSYYPKKSADKSGSGIGLKQVHRRLELAYPNKYEWNKGVHVDKNVYTSRLIIQTLNI